MPVDTAGRINIEEAEKIISNHIQNGNILACMIANGGTTIQMTIDPIKEVVDLRDRLAKKFNLDYSPHVHVDSVIGWAWLFFKNYDYAKNPLKLKIEILTKIKAMCSRISQVEYADSFGADFHKTGFCPYISSVFMMNDKEHIYNMGNVKALELDELEYGNYSPFLYTLELSRSVTGPISALTTLKCFGIEGFQKLIGGLMIIGENIKEILDANSEFEVINNDTEGFVTLFIIKSPGAKLRYKEIASMDKENAQKIGEYNYYFYLYLLEKQSQKKCTFVMDYSSGYDKTKSGIKIGVLKAFPMSPFANIENIKDIMNELFQLKQQYDSERDQFVPYEVPHKPRAFVFR